MRKKEDRPLAKRVLESLDVIPVAPGENIFTPANRNTGLSMLEDAIKEIKSKQKTNK